MFYSLQIYFYVANKTNYVLKLIVTNFNKSEYFDLI